MPLSDESGGPVDRRIKHTHCPDCGMALHSEAEFHPHAFCVWKRAGQDPWELLEWIVSGLGYDTKNWPKDPPDVKDARKVGGR